MRGFQDDMATGIDQRLFFLGIAPPENKDNRFRLITDRFNNRIGERFPAFPLVRVWRVGADGQNGIQQ